MAYCVVVFRCLAFVLLNFSAEMCAGSRASGCLFSKHFSFPKQSEWGGLVPPFWRIRAMEQGRQDALMAECRAERMPSWLKAGLRGCPHGLRWEFHEL